MRVFLTGATGIVGCEVVRELLHAHSGHSVVALIRGTPAEIERKRRRLLVWCDASEEQASRLETVSGDVTLPALGLSPADRLRLRDTTAVVHAAAITRFDQTAEAALANNVAATGHVFDLARGLPRVDRVALVSTAYVAGRRSGTIGEDDFDPDASFHNHYEQSKALAEQAARQRMADLPIAILRLSIVVGRRTDGVVSRLRGIYPILRLFHEGLLAMFPGDPEQLVDIIPSDFAAKAICHLLGDAFESGATWQICAGRDRSLRLGELFPHVAACIRATDARWHRRGQPLPLSVSDETFRDFIEIVEMTGDPRLREILRQTEALTALLDSPKVFDTTRFQAALARGGPQLTHIRQWFHPVIARAVQTNWQHEWKARPRHA